MCKTFNFLAIATTVQVRINFHGVQFREFYGSSYPLSCINSVTVVSYSTEGNFGRYVQALVNLNILVLFNIEQDILVEETLVHLWYVICQIRHCFHPPN